ncbi:MAG: hypothetical protein IID45_09710, partial [Planctomycetes bacterium]|nr:hypothetical protein [Planctomycetota bacterium]
HIAALNRVVGKPLQLGRNGKGGFRFGRHVVDDETGRSRFVETLTRPVSVRVTARRTRRNGNPIALLLRQISGQPSGNVTRRAEASIDNHVVGVRPFRNVPVPALPLAILAHDPTGRRSDTWTAQIERRGGGDQFAFDRKSGRVIREADGIPEIVLTTMPATGNATDGNVQLIDLNSDFRPDVIERQFSRGWSRRDLREHRGELRLIADSKDGLEFTSFGRITNSLPQQLRNLIGQSRICLLYSTHTPVGRIGFGRVRCRRFVAVRILSVRSNGDDSYRITVQPAVMTTRTALLADRKMPPAERRRFANRYIYKLQLTR